jgi:hypothetical protein
LKENDYDAQKAKQELNINLTTNGRAGMKRFCYVRVKLDVKVMLNSKIGITLLTSLTNPILEIVADLRENYITNVGAGHFSDFPEDR